MFILKLIGKASVWLAASLLLFAFATMLAFVLSMPVEVVFNKHNPMMDPIIQWRWYYLISIPASVYFLYWLRSPQK